MKGLALSLLLHVLLFVSFISIKKSETGFKYSASSGSISVNIYRQKTRLQKAPAQKKVSKTETQNIDSGVKEKIVLTDMIPPVYPEESRLYGEEGIVIVDLEINNEGKVASIQLSQSSGFERLDQAVVTQMKSSQFQDYKGEKLELSFKFELAN